ncbi:MAG: FecR domain-containing protein [Tannerellaceae bacterium]|jgi:ferric-dicitrate binding protein FerR (iron transport regulator)|nr:FecR domain-containing protein [Tannerellaceae bacterium]
MHYLISKYFKHKITQQEKDELFSLMDKDNELKREFISLQNLYGLYSLLPSENDEITALRKLQLFKRMRRRKNRLFLFKQAGGYVAAVCLTAFTTVLLIRYTPLMGKDARPPLAYEELTTPAGQRVMVKLHDGTKVWLNARSTLRYPALFVGDERMVELDGEAYFEVAHRENQPFVVTSGKLNVKALGTRFNVLAYKERNTFNTSLINGSVKIYNKGNESNAMILKPNEYAELESNRLTKHTFDNLNFLLWKDGIYAFDNMPFNDIMDKMQWYYDIKIDVHNRKLSNYKFSGKIRHRDGLESVLRTLQRIYHFSFVKDDELNIITIR